MENIGELMEMMGQFATQREAEKMADLLGARGIKTVDQARKMNQREFFAVATQATNALAAAVLGAAGGRATRGVSTRAKRRAARRNGKLGGRPPLYADLIALPSGPPSCDWQRCQGNERYAVYTRRRGLRHYCERHVSVAARRLAEDPARRGIPQEILESLS